MKKHLLTPVVFATLVSLFLLAANDWELPWGEPKRAAGVEWCEPHDVELAQDAAKAGVLILRHGQSRLFFAAINRRKVGRD